MTAEAHLQKYRASDQERARESSLLSLIRSGRIALDIGARDGYYSQILRGHYSNVVSLDLQPVQLPNCTVVAADIRAMPFPDRSFDLVFCAEVLEHVPNPEIAAREIARITNGIAIIGVPYRQDIRLNRLTCQACGRAGPPWGHVNSFDEDKLRKLFAGMRLERMELIGGPVQERTTSLAAALMDYARNPWGTYDQQERCACGQPYSRPVNRSLAQKLAGKAAGLLNIASSRLSRPHAIWVHAVFTR